MNIEEKTDLTVQQILRLEDAITAHNSGRSGDVDAIGKAVKRYGPPEDENTRELVRWAITLGHQKNRANPLLTRVPLTEPSFGTDGELNGWSSQTVPLTEAEQRLLDLQRDLAGLLKQQYPDEGDGPIAARAKKLLDDTARKQDGEWGSTRRRGELGQN